MDPVFATVFERGRELLVCVKGSFFFGTAPLSIKKTKCHGNIFSNCNFNKNPNLKTVLLTYNTVLY